MNPMQGESETLKTRWTLVGRLKNLDDEQSWGEFDRLYRPVVLRVARRAGLREEEAMEAAQETMASVSKHIRDFVADPARGSFRGWLLTMARWRIKDQFRKRLPVAAHGDRPTGTSPRTSTLERIADGRGVDLEELCDAEWRAWLIQQAMEALQLEVKADHYQVFYLLEVERRPIAEVAQMMGRNRAQMYVVKHRVAAVLKKLLRRLKKEWE